MFEEPEASDVYTFRLIGHYAGLEDSISVSVRAEPPPTRSLRALKITAIQEEDGPQPFLWGENVNRIKIEGLYGNGEETSIDVTHLAQIHSSNQSELHVVPSTPGVISTFNAVGDTSYTLEASFNGVSTNTQIYVIPRELDEYKILSPLGRTAFKSQPITFQSNLIIEQRDEFEEALLQHATWKSNTDGLTINVTDDYKATVDTSNLDLGFYEVEAEITYKGDGNVRTVSDTYEFEVVDTFERL